MTKSLQILLLATAAACAQAQSQNGAWSKPVNGLRGRLCLADTVTPEKMHRIKIYVELENLTDIANPLAIPFDPMATVKGVVTDRQGKPFKQWFGAADILSPTPYVIKLPHEGRLSFPVSVTGHSYPQLKFARIVELSNGCWIVLPGESVHVSATFSVPTAKPAMPQVWFGKLSLPSVFIPMIPVR